MQAHLLHRSSRRRTSKRVGRGGKRGKTCGRGTKGQRARAGRRIRPVARDLLKRIPKLRGHGIHRATSRVPRERSQVVSLSMLDRTFQTGERVTPAVLAARGLVRRRAGKAAHVTIVATGSLSKALTIEGCRLTQRAREAVEAAGGVVAA